MKKWTFIIGAVTAGVAICAFAPAFCQLFGVFLTGAGLYAAVEVLKQRQIGREIARYETLPRTVSRSMAKAASPRPHLVKERRRQSAPSKRQPDLPKPVLMPGLRARARMAFAGRRYKALPNRTVGLAHTVFFHTIS